MWAKILGTIILSWKILGMKFEQYLGEKIWAYNGQKILIICFSINEFHWSCAVEIGNYCIHPVLIGPSTKKYTVARPN